MIFGVYAAILCMSFEKLISVSHCSKNWFGFVPFYGKGAEGVVIIMIFIVHAVEIRLVLHLSLSFAGIIIEAKGIKEHHWKLFIKQLFEKKVKWTTTFVCDCSIIELNSRSI